MTFNWFYVFQDYQNHLTCIAVLSLIIASGLMIWIKHYNRSCLCEIWLIENNKSKFYIILCCRCVAKSLTCQRRNRFSHVKISHDLIICNFYDWLDSLMGPRSKSTFLINVKNLIRSCEIFTFLAKGNPSTMHYVELQCRERLRSTALEEITFLC